MNIKNFSFFIVMIFAFLGCSKEEGVGGNASVSGMIYVQDVSEVSGAVLSTYKAMDKDVYIIYGDHEVYDDKTSTSYNGRFQFKYLYPGSYTVYIYSECDTCAAGEEAKIIEFTLENKQAKDLDDIYIVNLK